LALHVIRLDEAPLPSSVMNSRRFNRLICIRCPSGVSAAYRIGEDQVRGLFRRGI